MNEISKQTMMLSGSHLAGLMQAVLDRNACFRFQAAGRSMTPFIRDGDIVSVFPVGGGLPHRKVMMGDVVVALDPVNGRVIVHRIVGELMENGKAMFVIKGDNCYSVDGWFDGGQIIGVIGRVERNAKTVWFGGGLEKRVVAFLSGTGILNRLALPILRSLKHGLV